MPDYSMRDDGHRQCSAGFYFMNACSAVRCLPLLVHMLHTRLMF